MHRIGLALSGGGFRATLFHLGLVRFLRDAQILPRVTHITSVSGGSILAAHLVLNWDRYNGSPHEFDAAAAELLHFVRLDVRNRIVRRFPLTTPIRVLRRLLLRGPNRKLTRTGLLELHYEKHLYGDTSLFQLPERPQLHILATNVNEGCLCSFTRNGLLRQRRLPGRGWQFDRIHIGLATVPMAVTASSAFPGFFPPLELTGAEVGANEGEFTRQAFTDGGVFDNLGVRMFRCLEGACLDRDVPIDPDDFLDGEAVAQALFAAARSTEESPLRRLAQLLTLGAEKALASPHTPAPHEASTQLVVGLCQLIVTSSLHQDPAFTELRPLHPEAASVLQAVRLGGQELTSGDRRWLNRQLLEAAFRLATGKPCLRAPQAAFDGVLVSDAGKPFKIIGHRRAGGLVSTAMRASDILMDRVWQLENETFQGTPGYVFAPISSVVEPTEDPTALHPELQRHAADIRTDLDRFSPLEISSLVRHGYCVGRKACRSQPDLFGEPLPANAPWDPMDAERHGPEQPPRSTLSGAGFSREPVETTKQARLLQASAQRRIWSKLFDFRDWTSFFYLPLLFPILVLLPYYSVKAYKQRQLTNDFVEAITQSGTTSRKVLELLQRGPVQPWTGMRFEEVGQLEPPDNRGFESLGDSLLVDLRPWKLQVARRTEDNSWTYSLRTLLLRKKSPTTGDDINNVLRVQLRSGSQKVVTRCQDHLLQPVLRLCKEHAPGSGTPSYVWELALDFSKVPVGEAVTVHIEQLCREGFQGRTDDQSWVSLQLDEVTPGAAVWVLLPEGKEYLDFKVIGFPKTKPDLVELVDSGDRLESKNAQIIAFGLPVPKCGYTYECHWTYSD